MSLLDFEILSESTDNTCPDEQNVVQDVGQSVLEDNTNNGGGDEVLQDQDVQILEVPIPGVFPSATKARPPREP